MARSRRRQRLVGWLAGAGALAVLPLAAAGVWLSSPGEVPDHSAELAARLTAAGESAEVIQCALRLAADDLRVGPLEREAADQLVSSCRVARGSLAYADRADDEEPAPAGDDRPNTLGDDPDLDELWAACEEGAGQACDRLFEQAPAGSGYETFGLTCGDRPDVLDCAELDRDPDA